MNVHVKLNKLDSPCVNDKDYSWTNCMMNLAVQKVGCSLNWFYLSDLPTCKTKDQMKGMQDFFTSVRGERLSSFNCSLPCYQKYFNVEKVVKNPLKWDTPWVSEAIIKFKSDEYEKRQEYFSYDEVQTLLT